MMNEITQEKANLVFAMEEQLKNELLKNEPDKLWENSFIRKQIEKRKKGKEPFTLQDHIRAMVYSMLSSGISWDKVANGIDPDTKCIIPIDKIFCNYDIKQLSEYTPEQLSDSIKSLGCATQSTRKQMEALLSFNVPKLSQMEHDYKTIDTYYKELIKDDNTLKKLITTLSATDSKDKLVQMNIALVCEYLRNAGYDIPKPDRHICRILGSEYLAFSDKKDVRPFEAFDIVLKLAKMTNKSVAEVDHILWSYCANGYGEICTIAKPKCNICVAKKYCDKKGNQKNGRFI